MSMIFQSFGGLTAIQNVRLLAKAVRIKRLSGKLPLLWITLVSYLTLTSPTCGMNFLMITEACPKLNVADSPLPQIPMDISSKQEGPERSLADSDTDEDLRVFRRIRIKCNIRAELEHFIAKYAWEVASAPINLTRKDTVMNADLKTTADTIDSLEKNNIELASENDRLQGKTAGLRRNQAM